MTKKRKLPANFGPKDLSKLPAGLRAYWEKKRKGSSSEKPNSSKSSAGDKRVTRKKAKPIQKPAKPAKKTPKKVSTGKKTDKPKREGGNDIKVVRKLVKTRRAK